MDRKETVTVTLSPMGIVRGRVFDAQTGRPVEQFKLRVGFAKNRQPGDPVASYESENADPGVTVNSKEGQFALKQFGNQSAVELIVEAEGYERKALPRVVAQLAKDTAMVEVPLDKREPIDASSVSGQIVDHESRSVAGVQLRLIVSAYQPRSAHDNEFNWILIKSGQLARKSNCDQFLQATSDTQGRFEFQSVLPGKFLQLAYWGETAPQGRSLAFDRTQPGVAQEVTVKLPQPAKIVGTIDIARFPNADAINAEVWEGAFQDYNIKIKDGQTNFEFANLPPGEYSVVVKAKPVRSTEREGMLRVVALAQQRIRVKAGETRTIHFSGPHKPGTPPPR
jgi:hypothetical protein